MSKIRTRLVRILVYVTYPLIIFGLIVTGTLLFIENRKYNQLNDSFVAAQNSLNKANQDKQITIDDLSEEFQSQSDTIADLRSENDLLKRQLGDLEGTGDGQISGKIYPFVTEETGFIQYQLVCAASITNVNLIYCASVSTLSQSYELNVPTGTYQVYATLYPTPQNDTLADKRAYYTEYISCVQTKSESECDSKKNAPVQVKVEAGQAIKDVDPISWQ